MLVKILIFSTVTLFFRFKCRLFISRKTVVILNGRALEPAFFCRKSTHMSCHFSALLPRADFPSTCASVVLVNDSLHNHTRTRHTIEIAPK